MSDDTVQDAPPAPEQVPPPPPPLPQGSEEVDEADDVDDDTVTERYKVPKDLYDNLKAMGFQPNAIKKAIIAGCIDENTCVQWLDMHLDHPELNTPIEPHIRVKIVKKRILSDAERAAKVEELKLRIIRNRALEAETAKKQAMDDEKRRIDEGKAALLSKASREAAIRKADLDQRKREKEEDRVRKEKLQLELAIDRLERLGLSRADATVKANQENEERIAKLLEERDKRVALDRAAREAEDARRATTKRDEPAVGAGQASTGWDLSKFVQPSESELAEAGGGGAAASSPAMGLVIDFDRDHAVSADCSREAFTSILQRSWALLPKDDPKSVAARDMLHRVLKAIQLAPLERKVRTLKVTSGAFSQKIVPMPLACLYLRQAGFQEASSSTQLQEAGVSDLFTMHVCITAKVRNALDALEAA